MQAHDLSLLIDAARIAGRIATSFVGPQTACWEKDGGAGPVTAADFAVNEMLQGTLRSARPDYGWLSEESEDTDARLERDTVFIIDPIDGTRSFIEGRRTWAHSLAIAHQGIITAAAIYLPLRDKMFTAAKGQGAALNRTPLRVSTQASLAGSQSLATKPTMQPDHWPNGLPTFERAHRPSLAYRLSLVAAGAFDAMFTFRPSWEWDIAAGALIVTEAGGKITTKTGADLRFNNAHPALDGVIAGGPAIHRDTLATLGVPTS